MCRSSKDYEDKVWLAFNKEIYALNGRQEYMETEVGLPVFFQWTNSEKAYKTSQSDLASHFHLYLEKKIQTNKDSDVSDQMIGDA